MKNPAIAYEILSAAACGREVRLCIRCVKRGAPTCPHGAGGRSGECPDYHFDGREELPQASEFPVLTGFTGKVPGD